VTTTDPTPPAAVPGLDREALAADLVRRMSVTPAVAALHVDILLAAGWRSPEYVAQVEAERDAANATAERRMHHSIEWMERALAAKRMHESSEQLRQHEARRADIAWAKVDRVEQLIADSWRKPFPAMITLSDLRVALDGDTR
jgi:hypothetical protein